MCPDSSVAFKFHCFDKYQQQKFWANFFLLFERNNLNKITKPLKNLHLADQIAIANASNKRADEMRILYRLIMQNCQQQIFKYSLMHETNQLLNKPTYCEKCYKKYYCRIQNTDWLNFWQIIPASLFTELRKLKMTMKKYRFVYKKHHFSRVFGCYSTVEVNFLKKFWNSYGSKLKAISRKITLLRGLT